MSRPQDAQQEQIAQAAHFLAHLWRGGAFAYWWTLPGRRSYWFRTEEERTPPPADRVDLYFGVHPCTEIPPTNAKGEKRKPAAVRSQIGTIAAINVLFAEYDAKDHGGDLAAALAHVESLTPAPSVVVASGGGYHVYWFLADPWILDTEEERARAVAIQAAWVAHMGGDEGAKDLARVLRVPGTLNRKYDPPRPVEIVTWEPERLYTVDELAGVIPEPEPVATAPSVSRETGPVTGTRAERWARAALEDELDKLAKTTAGGRNAQLNRSAFALGQIVGGGYLDETDTADQLAATAQAIGLTDGEAHKTIASGMAAGKKEPRHPEERPQAPRRAEEPPGGRVAPDLPPNTPTPYSNGDGPPSEAPAAQAHGPSEHERAVIDLLVSLGNLDMLRHALADMDRGVLGYVKHQADAAGLFANAEQWAKFVETCRFKADPLSDQIRADLRKWEYFFRMNDLDDVIEVNGRPIDDGIRAQIRVTARDDGYGDRSRRSLTALEDVYRAEAAAHRAHPVKDYLNGLAWDGADHFAQLAGHFTDRHDPITYADGSRVPVFAAFLWRWMIGAVAKTFDAGTVRAQNPMLVIVGGQGLGKSTFCQYLASPLPTLFVASPVNPDSTDHRRLLATRWIWEAGELGATVRKADREALKEFLTLPDVTFRKPYDRDPIQKPALTSFLGTLNPEQGFLNDPTGSRRFLVVELATIDHAYIDAVDINQVWAQVMAHYRQDRNAYMLRRAEVETRNKINGLHETERPFESLIRKYFAIDPEQTGADWWIMSADVADRLQTVGNVRAGDSGTQKAIGYAMKSLGVERKQRKVDGSPVWGYQGIQQRERGISTPDPDDDQGNQ